MFSVLYFRALFKCVMPALVQEVPDLGSKFYAVYELGSLTIRYALHSPGLYTASLQSHRLFFRINILLVPGKYIFYDAISDFCVV